MRQKKSGFIWYAIAGAVAAVLVWAISQDVSVNVEQVEETLQNNL